MRTCSAWSVDVRVVLWLSSHYFFYHFFFYFFDSVFFPISIRIDILWAQLLLEVSIDHFENMHTCSTLSEDVHVVWGLSSH